MRLIDCCKSPFRMEEFMTPPEEPFAILSHTWQDEEITFQDFADDALRTSRKGWGKVQRTCLEAQQLGYRYVWIDSCCIDKTSSAELTESINSMFQWYSDADTCLVYLFDFHSSVSGTSMLSSARWFSRGWTLQELVAAKKVRFYDVSWQFFGTRETLHNELVHITHISPEVLSPPPNIQVRDLLDAIPIAKRMSWATNRFTKKPEDIAYCLIGLFDVNMPLLYGEGAQKAFVRLQEEIIRDNNDLSIFAWKSRDEDSRTLRGIFANSPSEFYDAQNLILDHDVKFNPDYVISNKGLRIQTFLHPRKNSEYLVMPLRCRSEGAMKPQLGIILTDIGASVYVRAEPHILANLRLDTPSLGGNSIFVSKKAVARIGPVAEKSTAVDKIGTINFKILDRNKHVASATLLEAEPKELWYARNQVFVTRGLRSFTGFLRYQILTQTNVMGTVVVACGFTERGVAWVAFEDNQGDMIDASLKKDLFKIAEIGPRTGSLKNRKHDLTFGRKQLQFGWVKINCEVQANDGELALNLTTSTSRACDCFTATITSSLTGCGVPQPCQPCIKVETTVIPGHNSRCSETPTITSYIPCSTQCPKGCPTSIYTSTARYTCARPTPSLSLTSTLSAASNSPTPIPSSVTSSAIGKEGDACGRFRIPRDPLCGAGLTCVLDDPRVPDKGGICLPSSVTVSHTPTPKPTLIIGKEGDKCGAFVPIGNPAGAICDTGLRCVLTDPQIPDLGGICRKATSQSPPTTTSWMTITSLTSSEPAGPITKSTRPCPTKTVTSPDHCPEDLLGCPYDCIALSTTTVPPTSIIGCPTTTPTNTITMSRFCRYTCYGACSTSWITSTATSW
ncbi:unnamed protein product [Periconia digitata]|uniref:Heterokaryon incompatibility domain-containing protein n=1 Tax=Periconia digitata TaxID=1303443 RepID=A0A9W4U9Q6_9PLEO|nr:unnamed protein product [Periconia digitata]